MTVHRITSTDPEPSAEWTEEEFAKKIRCIGRIFCEFCFALRFQRPAAAKHFSHPTLPIFINQISGELGIALYAHVAIVVTSIATWFIN